MTEVNPADLRATPSHYQSSRELHDVLVGNDDATSLIHFSAIGDTKKLHILLEQSPEIALDSPHRIYHVERPAEDRNDVRCVTAAPRLNLNMAIFRAAENGHASAVSVLLDFALRNGVKPLSVIHRDTIRISIQNGHAVVFNMLAKAEPTVATFNIQHGQRPLDLAIDSRKLEVAKVILARGGGRQFPDGRPPPSYRNSRMCRAARSSTQDMVELLIRYGYAVHGSGALQSAAERGVLETMRLLVEVHAADVNERLPAETLPRHDNALFASWTPLHFAARCGREDAMELLESYGAKTDVLDANGKTPSQLLADRKRASGSRK